MLTFVQLLGLEQMVHVAFVCATYSEAPCVTYNKTFEISWRRMDHTNAHVSYFGFRTWEELERRLLRPFFTRISPTLDNSGELYILWNYCENDYYANETNRDMQSSLHNVVVVGCALLLHGVLIGLWTLLMLICRRRQWCADGSSSMDSWVLQLPIKFHLRHKKFSKSH